MIVVSDTTPLISLMKASQLHMLQGLYGEILIPEAVFAELTENHEFQEESEEIRRCPFIKVVAVSEPRAVDVLQRATGLNLGESEAIIFADENKADTLLMDEAAGRRVAKSMGIHIMGTIGVLLGAYDEGIITAGDVRTAIEKLRQSKRWISKELLEYALDYIGRQG